MFVLVERVPNLCNLDKLGDLVDLLASNCVRVTDKMSKTSFLKSIHIWTLPAANMMIIALEKQAMQRLCWWPRVYVYGFVF